MLAQARGTSKWRCLEPRKAVTPLPTPQSLFDLKGRTALITGAGSGIGAAIAEMLAGAGAHVICAGRTRETIEARAQTIRDSGGCADALVMDVSNEADVEAAFQGIEGLDILINNAALMPKYGFLEMRAAEWDAVQATNLRGAFLCAREAVKRMRVGGDGGAIVNIASVAAAHAAVYGNAQYGASKAGLLALTRSIALEFADGAIRCNAILPGAIATEGGRKAAISDYPPRGPFAEPGRILLGRIGKPADVAAAALFLVSDAASYVTGQSLVVDGGLMIG